MAGDVLAEMLALVRQANPDIPDAIWRSIEAQLRGEYGGDRHYISRRAKATHLGRLEAAAQADQTASNEQLAQLLGVGVRRVQQLKRLREG